MILGASFINTATITDANEAPVGMNYVALTGSTTVETAHVPDSNHVLLQTIAIGQGRKVQYAYATFKNNSPQGIFYRISNNNGTFTNVAWIRMYDQSILNDSTILAELKAALASV